MGNGHLPAAHVPPEPGILLNYKKGEESWGFSVMKMQQLAAACCLEAGLRLLDNG